VSERLPSRDQALILLSKIGCSTKIIEHCKAVANLALEIARLYRESGVDVDIKLIEAGALLHDIGRAKTHSVHHAIIGSEIAKSLGLPENIILIIKRHVGGGITMEEAKKLGWPKEVYIPETIEEKIIAYADKLIEGTNRVSIERTIEVLAKKIPMCAIVRIRKLHQEIQTIIGDF
jgi:uncharacterized protein